MVSNGNVLTPDLFRGELKLATAMYTWKRVWVVCVSDVVCTHLESLHSLVSDLSSETSSEGTYAVAVNPGAMELKQGRFVL